MNDQYDGFRSLHSYLSILEAELDLKIRQTMVDVRKLQDIYEAIRPVEDTAPKENKEITRLINLAKGIQVAESTEKNVPLDPYSEFQKTLEAFNKIPGKKHKDLSQEFVRRVLDCTPKTEAHVIHRLIPCLKSLNREMGMILQYNIEEPSFCFRATYGTEKAESVANTFLKEMESFPDIKKIDCNFREKVEPAPEIKPKQHQISPQFETFAKLKIKQLSSIFRKRGDARRSLINYRIKEKLEEVLMPYLRSTSDEVDELVKLKTASKCFPILSDNPRSYALIVESNDVENE